MFIFVYLLVEQVEQALPCVSGFTKKNKTEKQNKTDKQERRGGTAGRAVLGGACTAR
jgi:hypothetical protein